MAEQIPENLVIEKECPMTAIASDRLYVYLGDRYTREDLRGALCRAVTRNGRCVCGRNGTMLVEFSTGEVSNVLRRRLRKVGERGAKEH